MTQLDRSATPRARLDAIRELVLPDAKVRGKPCMQCGYRSLREPCPLCGGKPVRASNLLRAVRELAEVRL